MSWSERLHKIIFEKALYAAGAKVAKDPLAPLATSANGVSEKNGASISSPMRHAYTFRLHHGEGGGTYLTDVSTLTAARAELAKIYGDRLAVVATSGPSCTVDVPE